MLQSRSFRTFISVWCANFASINNNAHLADALVCGHILAMKWIGIYNRIDFAGTRKVLQYSMEWLGREDGDSNLEFCLTAYCFLGI